jgi:antitoxin component YwqK of YwqJK toxin-antitoxin module
MRFFYIFALIVFIFYKADSQPVHTRYLNSIKIGTDSVILFFDEKYGVIEDSCARIIRYSHYDFKQKHYRGNFKDVSKSDATLIIAEGSYTEDGKKEGAFSLNFLDGKPQAKGSFKNDKYEGDWVFYYPNGNVSSKGSFKNGEYNGRWEFYYEDSKPKIFFEVSNGIIKIFDNWSIDGTKTLDRGNGDYTVDNKPLYWKGKLANGTPDDLWTYQISDDVFGSELFKNGRFISGRSNSSLGTRDYNDKSRIVLLQPLPKLIIVNAETLIPSSPVACNGINYSMYGVLNVQLFK